ncbi:GNAT family N-acetyltransferase [Ammoniphilus sp. 3BR4]|uniref:GNAT family N-acetyltransferase n=1 Tax=Ammoniphilus sp. 3BR4 TaxID=3158265 RepID=UPI00346587BC
MITLEMLHGQEIERYIEQLALFRVKDFREFPYLYVGDLEREKGYIQHYTKNEKALLVIAKDDDKVIGISSGIPLEKFLGEAIAEQLAKIGLDSNHFYYFGETILLPEYRKKGIGRDIYKMREEYARSAGYTEVCFMAVVREEDHPLRPKDYKSPEDFWVYMGYEKLEITADFTYPTVQANGQVEKASNKMVFWKKHVG